MFDQVQIIRKSHAARPRSTTTNFERIYLINGQVRCASCGRNLRAQGYRAYRYYREVSSMRGFECEDSGTYVMADILEEQVARIVQAFQFPPDWQQEIKEAMNAELEPDHLTQDRKEITNKLKRLGELYLDGMIEKQAYLSTREELNQSLGALTSPEPDQIIETGKTLESFLQIWPQASDSQKREICRLMFEWIEIDMRKASVTRVMPRFEFTRFFEKNALLVHDIRGGYAPTFNFAETPQTA